MQRSGPRSAAPLPAAISRGNAVRSHTDFELFIICMGGLFGATALLLILADAFDRVTRWVNKEETPPADSNERENDGPPHE